MSQKIAVVTGGNKGIGYAIVKGLCQKYEGLVYLTARDVARGEAAVAKLKTLGFKPIFHQLDISDQNSVDKFKEFIKTSHGGIDVLVNNAGVIIQNETLANIAEKTISINYFGTLIVCEALFPLLRSNAKVVNISSSAGLLHRIPSAELRSKISGKVSTLTVADLNKLMKNYVEAVKENKAQVEGWGSRSYAVSKVGLTALTIIHQRLFDGEQPNRNISINAVHPGYVMTDLTENKGHLTIEEGAKAPLYLALDSNLKGKYIWYDCRVVDWYNDTTPPKLNI